MEYKIPEKILSQIPEYFWYAFVGELVSVFGLLVFEKDLESELMGLNYISSTTGWNAALKMACHKLDMDWLYKYYDNLEWWESDLFDGEFEDLIKVLFINGELHNTHTNPYYLWLIGE